MNRVSTPWPFSLVAKDDRAIQYNTMSHANRLMGPILTHDGDESNAQASDAPTFDLPTDSPIARALSRTAPTATAIPITSVVPASSIGHCPVWSQTTLVAIARLLRSVAPIASSASRSTPFVGTVLVATRLEVKAIRLRIATAILIAGAVGRLAHPGHCGRRGLELRTGAMLLDATVLVAFPMCRRTIFRR